MWYLRFMQTITKAAVRAGKATITVANGKGEHYTFQVNKKEPQIASKWAQFGPSWFVALLTGPNNNMDYTYMGMLSEGLYGNGSKLKTVDTVKLTAKSKFTPDTKPVKVFNN